MGQDPLPGKLQNVDPHPFIVHSCPKCGTHLIMKLLRLLTGQDPILHAGWELYADREVVERAKREGKFVMAHNWPPELLEELVDEGYKVVFQTRDPRDQIVSIYYWFLTGHRGPYESRTIEDLEEQINEMITGERFGWMPTEKAIEIPYRAIASLPEEAWLMTKFEDLVGERGGGDPHLQIKAVIELAHFLEIELRPGDARAIASDLYGGTWTFRKGQIGEWKKHFLPYQVDLFDEYHGELMADLNYLSPKAR